MEKNDDVIVIDTGSSTTPSRIVKKIPEILPIHNENSVSLRNKIADFDPKRLPSVELSDYIKSMKNTMKRFNGLGLSANQVGLSIRMFVIGTDQFQIACINPKILQTEGLPEKMPEGCLSFPGLLLHVPRYKKIFVEYYTEDGDKKQVWMEGLTAQCFQHELEHLDGVCYTDRVGPLALKMARKRQSKFIKNVKRATK